MGKIQKIERLSSGAVTEDCSQLQEVSYDYNALQLIDTPYGKRCIFSHENNDTWIKTNKRLVSFCSEATGSISFKCKRYTDDTLGTVVRNSDGIVDHTTFVAVLFIYDNIRVWVTISSSVLPIVNITIPVSNTNLNKWCSYTVSLDGTKATVFEDGIQIGSSSISSGREPPTSDQHKPFTIGSSYYDKEYNNCFDGELSDVIIDSNVWTNEDAIAYHNDQVFDYDIHCSSSCELDDLTTIENRGYSELDGIVTGGTIVNTPVGKGFDNDVPDGSIVFDKHILPTGGNKDFSISIWYRFKDRPWQQHHNMFDNGGFRLQNGYTIFIHRTDKNLRFNKDGITEVILPIGSAVDGEWAHLIVTSKYIESTSKTTLDFYIDGSLVNTFTDAKWNNDTEYSTDTLIGNCWYNTIEDPLISSSSYRFKGALAKFKIFDKAITSLQVKDVYNDDLTEPIHYDVIKDPTEW